MGTQTSSNPLNVGMSSAFYSDVDSFKLVASLQQEVDAVKEAALGVLKNRYRSVESLSSFISEQGTPVHVIGGNLLQKCLMKLLGFEPGFIPLPKTTGGKRRLKWLIQLLGLQRPKQKFTLEHGVFVLTQRLFTVGFVAHQLHHWLSSRAGLPGFGEREQELYKIFWGKHKGMVGPEVDRMTAEEITLLRHAIHRDLEALRFIRQVTEEIFFPAQEGGKLKGAKHARRKASA